MFVSCVVYSIQCRTWKYNSKQSKTQTTTSYRTVFSETQQNFYGKTVFFFKSSNIYYEIAMSDTVFVVTNCFSEHNND